MKAEVEIKNKKYNVDFSKGIDISIPLYFNGEQPNTYGVDKATSIPYQDGQFIGDTRRGGRAILKPIILRHIVMAPILNVLVILQMKELTFYLL